MRSLISSRRPNAQRLGDPRRGAHHRPRDARRRQAATEAALLAVDPGPGRRVGNAGAESLVRRRRGDGHVPVRLDVVLRPTVGRRYNRSWR